MLHQHFMLADNLTVLENICFGASHHAGHPRHASRPAADPRDLDRYGLGLRPDRLVEELGVGDRQRVEIARSSIAEPAFSSSTSRPRCSSREVDELFASLRS